MNGYEKQVKDILKRHGWWDKGTGKGSHQVWTNGKNNVTVNHVCKSRHTANRIMKDAGLDRRF